MGLVLAIDQGTHASRASVYDDSGEVLASAARSVGLDHLPGRRVQQDPRAILDSVRDAVGEVLGAPGTGADAVTRAGLATQRSSVVAWDRFTGQALSPVLSWLDRRADDLPARYGAAEEQVRLSTGLLLSGHFGAGKLAWMLNELPAVRQAAREERLAMGPLASYLIFHLLEQRPLLADHANAARTLLFNLARRDWDPALLDLFAIPGDVLPACRPVCADYGTLAGYPVTLTAVSGDQGAAACACGGLVADTVTVNMGSGAFILLPAGGTPLPVPGLLGSIVYSDADSAMYCVEGTVNGAGVALDRVGREWGVGDLYATLEAGLGSDEAPPVWINRVGGLGSPWWRAEGESGFLDEAGAEGASLQARLAGVAESILFLLQANLDRMLSAGQKPESIRVSGGLAGQDGLCRRLADLSGLQVRRAAGTEMTSRGIAWLAAGRPGHWSCGAGEAFAPGQARELEQRYRRFMQALD